MQSAPYLKAQADNGSIMVGVPTDTQAKYGFRVWKSGKALSKITPAESGSDYSLHTKVKGDAVLRFKLRVHSAARTTSYSSKKPYSTQPTQRLSIQLMKRKHDFR